MRQKRQRKQKQQQEGEEQQTACESMKIQHVIMSSERILLDHTGCEIRSETQK